MEELLFSSDDERPDKQKILDGLFQESRERVFGNEDVQVEQEGEQEEETPSRQSLRARKGKGLVIDEPEVRHKSVRFTQGTLVDEEVEEENIMSEEYAATKEPDIQLDDNGDIIEEQADQDFQMNAEEEGFDNNELEAEVRNERMETLESIVGVSNVVQHEVEYTMPRQAAGTTRKKKAKPSSRGGRKIPSTYARFAQGRTAQVHSDEDIEGDQQEDPLELGEVPEDEVRGQFSGEEEDAENFIPFNEEDMQNPKLKINLVFGSRDQAKEAVTWYAL